MSSCVLLAVLFTFHVSLGSISFGDRDETQTVCAGKEFRLPVYSTFSTVTFTPNTLGQRRVLLEKTTVKDPRFEWTRDKMLVLKEVTREDQGVYAIKMSSGFTYETVRLIVSECIRSYHRNYGENFDHSIPENGSLLEFSPRGAPSEAMPVVLWNRTASDTSTLGRGRLLRGGKVWVAERVTQADQGNYTVRDFQGKALLRSTLAVHGHTFNVTRFTKESLNLPLFLPLHNAHLIFTPSRHPDESSLGPFDPRPPRGPIQLMSEGHITDHDMRYRGLVSVGRNGSLNEVVIARLTSRHVGTYEIRDLDGNLVSSTSLQVIDKGGKWRAILKSITVPSGMFVSLAGFILFMKRYPTCSLSQIITGIRPNRTPQANPPNVNIQDYSHSAPQPSNYYSHQHPGTPRKWTPGPSPAHVGYTSVMEGSPSHHSPAHARADIQHGPTVGAGGSPARNSSTMVPPSEEDPSISFSLPGASNCLHSSEDCVQFQIKTATNKERQRDSQPFFSQLPLDTDTSESCSVYVSEKLNFL
ncbi:uncharacterized protein ACB058_012063 isoform 1-T1 [Synchiropus picturatus]